MLDTIVLPEFAMRRSIVISLSLSFAAGAAFACPDASKNADAKLPAAMQKDAAAPQMTPAPQAAQKAAVLKPAAKSTETTAAAVRKPAGG